MKSIAEYLDESYTGPKDLSNRISKIHKELDKLFDTAADDNYDLSMVFKEFMDSLVKSGYNYAKWLSDYVKDCDQIN